MRIAHITDIHVTRIPSITQMTPKRFLGTANLLIGGRRHHFSSVVQEAMVDGVDALEPDVIVCTGDITQTSIPQEFEGARELLAPIFDKYRTVLIGGNHDTYTQRAWKGQVMQTYFDAFMGSGPWPRVHHLSDTLSVVCVDTCRAHLTSSGQVEATELQRLRTILEGEELRGRGLFIALHYPLRDRRGDPYGPPARALTNAEQLEQVLMPHGARIHAILHGHEHHGYRTSLGRGDSAITILNPGSSGYAWLPKKRRTAHFNLYTLDGSNLHVDRFAYCGKKNRFVPEEGGAYKTGG